MHPSCDVAHPIAVGIAIPFGNRAMAQTLASKITASAWAVPRRRLLDPTRRRVQDSVTVQQAVSASFDAAGDQATVSGTYTNHLAITLKRLRLSR